MKTCRALCYSGARLFRRPNGFSLVELLVVLAILVVLMVLSSSRFNASARRRDLAACQKNLEKIYLALSLYQGDNDAFPFLSNAGASEIPLSGLIPKCTTDTAIFICPGSRDKPLPEGERFGQRRISYAYYMGWATNDPNQILVTDWQVDTNGKRKGELVFSPDGKRPANNHYAEGGNFLSCGGEVSQSRPKAARDLPLPPGGRLLNP